MGEAITETGEVQPGGVEDTQKCVMSVERALFAKSVSWELKLDAQTCFLPAWLRLSSPHLPHPTWAEGSCQPYMGQEGQGGMKQVE